MKKPSLKRVIIDPDVADTPIAQRYAAWAKDRQAEVIKRSEDADVHAGHTLTSGKREVHLTRGQGAAVRQCTGLEPQYVCCNLHVMHQTSNCPLDCSYCILQVYLNAPVTTVYTNTDELIARARAQADTQPDRLFRVGTGDIGDSLALDEIGGVTRELVPEFAKIPNVVLELKTKSNFVEGLLDLQHEGRVVIAWSLNTPHIIKTEEHGCATLAERLEAAARVAEAGYPVAFHFDPMVIHEGWETAYPAVVKAIFEAVPSERIAWISMGALRFPPSMRTQMEARFPNSQLPLGEFVLANDRKMRYLKPVRIALYRSVLDSLRICGGEEVFVYLCMETSEVWRRAVGSAPESNHHLDFAFATSVVSRFQVMPEPPRWEFYRDAQNLSTSSSNSE